MRTGLALLKIYPRLLKDVCTIIIAMAATASFAGTSAHNGEENLSKATSKLTVNVVDTDLEITGSTQEKLTYDLQLDEAKDKDKCEFSVNIDDDQIEIEVENEKSFLSIFGSTSACRGKLVVTIPNRLMVETNSVSGDVRLEGVSPRNTNKHDAINVSSTSGNVNIDKSQFKKGEINTVSGDIKIVSNSLAGSYKTVSGNFKINLETLDNDVELSLSTISGDIDLVLAKVTNKGNLSVDSVSGDVKISLPETNKLKLTTETVSGRVSKDVKTDDASKFEVSLTTISGDLSLKSL